MLPETNVQNLKIEDSGQEEESDYDEEEDDDDDYDWDYDEDKSGCALVRNTCTRNVNNQGESTKMSNYQPNDKLFRRYKNFVQIFTEICICESWQ